MHILHSPFYAFIQLFIFASEHLVISILCIACSFSWMHFRLCIEIISEHTNPHTKTLSNGRFVHRLCNYCCCLTIFVRKLQPSFGLIKVIIIASFGNIILNQSIKKRDNTKVYSLWIEVASIVIRVWFQRSTGQTQFLLANFTSCWTLFSQLAN